MPEPFNKTPRKFVGLHAHSLSVGDSIGLPQEHIDFALSNGMDGLALTDHGHMNGIGYQHFKQQELDKKGIKFKTIPAIEAYYVDSLSDWRDLYNKSKQQQKPTTGITKSINALPSIIDELNDIGDENKQTKKELDDIASEKQAEDEESGTLVEDEGESKKKQFNPLNARSHLVLLPKNADGIKSLFRLTSESFIDGFYKYPRIDLEMLKKHSKGNLIASTACVASFLGRTIFDCQEGDDWNLWAPNNHRFEEIQEKLKLKVDGFIDALGGKENYYLELQCNKLLPQHLMNMHLIELSKRTGCKLIVTADSHYSNPDHWKEREIYKAMAWASKTKGSIDPKSLPQKIEELKCELYPKNADQLWETYKEIKASHPEWTFYDDELVCDAIERTHSICHEQIGELKFDKTVKLPALVQLVDQKKIDKWHEKLDKPNNLASEDDIAFKELVQVAKEGLIWRKKENNQEYVDRLIKELQDIKYLQENSHFRFAKYFLTYKKIMELTTDKQLTGAGRGSSAGSLLAYVLNITQIDPIRFETLWERFLTRFKKGAADIDGDWSDRDTAVRILINYFGEENVIPVSNFNALQLRSLIKDVARLHDLPFDEINAATSKIEFEVIAEKKKEPGFDRGTWVLTYEQAELYSSTFNSLINKYSEFEHTIKILFKQGRNTSKHAGGVLLTSNARESMPLIKSGGELQTPWPEGQNSRQLEEFGLLKFDILGLGTLKMFEECIAKILKKNGNKNPQFSDVKEWYLNNLHPDTCDLDDQHVYKHVFHDKNYIGIFQAVQDNVQNFLAEMKPTKIEDLSIATSIFRPGPLSLKIDRLYLRNRNNPDCIQYKHPLLEQVLKETSGLLIYQESLMQIYHKLAGIPLDETDSVRKAFTKKDISNKAKAKQDRDALRETFIRLCEQNNAISPVVSGSIFDEMEALVAYAFNKSHGISYAVVMFQCAKLFTYYPDEWVTTYIDYCSTSKGKVTGKQDPKAVAINEAKRLGYEIVRGDINTSLYEYTMHPTLPKTLVPSFGSLKHVGKTVVEEIERFRPYTTLESLLIDSGGVWKHSKFNKRALATLIKVEALSSMDIVGEGKLFKNYKQVHEAIIINYDSLKRIAAKKKNNDITPELTKIIESVQNIEDWSSSEKVDFHKELSGSVDFEFLMPLDIQKKLEDMGVTSIDSVEWCSDEDGTPVEKNTAWAIVESAGFAITKTGKKYLKIRVFAEANKTVTCFVWAYKGDTTNIKPNDIIVLEDYKKSDFGLTAWQNKIYRLNDSC